MVEKIETLTKHTALVHASCKLSIVERKLNNVLLKHAFDYIDSKETHTIEIKNLRELYGMSDKYDRKLLENSLQNIRKKDVEFNIFGQDKKNPDIWVNTSFLSYVKLDYKKGICSYGYPEPIREILKNPNIYARLNMEIQREFSSKYAIALWEYLEEHQCRNNEKLYTSWLSLLDFKKLCGVPLSLYNNFKYINKNIIKTQLKEVNKVSGLNVEVEYKKKSRKVTAIRFKVSRKEGFEYQKSLEGISPNETIEPKEEIINSLIEDYQLSKVVGKSLVKLYPLEQIQKNLVFVDDQVSKDLVKNIGAFTKNAIEMDLRLKESKFDREEREKSQKLLEDSKRRAKEQEEQRKIEEEEKIQAQQKRQKREKIYTNYSSEHKQSLLDAKKKDYPELSHNEEMLKLLIINEIEID